jgi:hypothetical protein
MKYRVHIEMFSLGQIEIPDNARIVEYNPSYIIMLVPVDKIEEVNNE